MKKKRSPPRQDHLKKLKDEFGFQFCLLLAFLCGIICSTLATNLERSSIKDNKKDSFETYRGISLEKQANDLFKFGCPQYDLIQVKNGYAIGYDPRTRIPWWGYEVISSQMLTGEASRAKIDFREDFSLPSIHRSNLSDYKKSGFDRGHLVPAGNYKYSQEVMDSTFILSNIAPMASNINQGCWNHLEQWVRNQVINNNSKAHVVSGTLFLPKVDSNTQKKTVSYSVIGKNQVAVPTHLFKAILFEYNSGKIEKWAFIVPNDAPLKTNDFWKFKSTIEKVEEVSGLLLFRKANSH